MFSYLKAKWSCQQLPSTTYAVADNTIWMERKQQPENLIHLLSKFVNFKGVEHFDSNQIPSLHSQEPANCWTLPIVTLTSIAVAVPHIAQQKRKNLLSSVKEGLSLAKLVEKTLIKDDARANIREAADMCWGGVEVYMKWLDIDLAGAWQNSQEMLQDLSQKSERIVVEYLSKEVKNPAMEDPINWPAKVIAANSTYRISASVALSVDEERDDEAMLEKACVMIADVMAACWTNFITTMCQRTAIEKREKSVRKAFLLLGTTEKIVEALQQQEWPPMDHDRAADIQQWRALFRRSESALATFASNPTHETVVTIF